MPVSTRGLTISTELKLVTEECYQCGVTFAMPEDFKRYRLADQETFYCPNGHGQCYAGKTDAQKLREAKQQLERAATRERALRDQADASERSNRALKGVITRTKNRVANGVCPCCHRTFPDLADHMKDQHPNYATEESD